MNKRACICLLATVLSVCIITVSAQKDVSAQTPGNPDVPLSSANSEGTMDGVNLQRTRVFRTKGVHQINGLVWKSPKLFEINYRLTLTPAFDGSMNYADIGFSEPVLTNGLIYFQLVVSLHQNYIVALDRNTGRNVWTFSLKDGLSAPAIAGNSIYVAALDGNLYALNAQTGTEEWTFNSKGQQWSISSSPAVVDGAVYFTSWSGSLYAVDISTKQPKWVFKADGRLTSPAFNGDVAYIGSDKGVLYAVDIKTGQEKWRFKAKAGLNTQTVADGTIYFRTRDGSLYGVDAKTGQQKWVAEVGGKVSLFPFRVIAEKWPLAFYDGTIFFDGSEGGSEYLYAVDAQTGKQDWKFKVATSSRSPVVADGVVYLGSRGNLYAVDAKTGTQKWVLETKSEYQGRRVSNMASSPAIVDGTAYFVTDDGFFYAMR
jgi:outer membrane protein assembly factor BamB